MNTRNPAFFWGGTLACVALLFSFAGRVGAQESDPRLIIDAQGPSGQVKELIFTSDGSTLISMGDDKAVRFWDVASGDLRKTLRLQMGDGHEGKHYAGALSPDGKWLALAGWAQTLDERYGDIRLVNLDTNKVEVLLRGHGNVIHDLDFSDDGQWLVSGSFENLARVWDLRGVNDSIAQGQVLEIFESQALEGHTSNVYSVSFHPSGDRIATGAYDNTVKIWKRDGDGPFYLERTIEGHTAEVRAAGFSPDGRYIVSGGNDQKLLLWDTYSGELVRTLDEDMESILSTIAFSPDSQYVLASSQASAVGYTAVYDVNSGERITQFYEHNNTVRSSAWHPTEDLVATAGGDDEDIYIWRPSSGELVHHIRGDGRAGWAVAFSTQGRVAVAFGQGLSDTRILDDAPLQRSFDFTNFELTELPQGEGDPAGFQRAVYTQGGKELIWVDSYHLDTGSGSIENDPKIEGRIHSFSFTPSGNVIVGSDFALRLHSATGEVIREFIGHEGMVWAVAASPDGRYIATASHDQTVKLWNVDTAELLASLFVSREGEWVCWMPTGQYHASAGGEKYIGWHINKGIAQVADYYPSYVFREQYQFPQLVKRSVLLGDSQKALAEVGETRNTSIAEVLPPHIDWILPAQTRGTSSGKEITVKADISSPNAELEEVKLLVNGKAVMSKERIGGNKLSYEENITLLPGENRLALFARNTRAGHTSNERTLMVSSNGKTMTLPELSDTKDLDKLLKPNLYVLAVGVSEYEDKNIPSLTYCDDDATAIADFFRKQENGIFGKTEVKLLTNKDATEGEIQFGLDWLADNATQQDFVVLFLAAHGVNDERGNFYLLPNDANPERLRSTGVAWDDFGEILGNLPSRVLMFLDTCHSGRLGANLFTMANVDGVRTRSLGGLKSAFDPTEAIRELTSEENGVVIMAASTGDEESMEHDDWGHGAFTMGLLQGLGGKADVNGDGIVHLRELDFFVSDNVKVLTGGRQHPTTVKPSTISRLPVARVK